MDNESMHAGAIPDSERAGFCQDCGRPLTKETMRTVGSGVFCEPCLEVRVAAGTAGAAAVPPVSPGNMPPGVFPAMGGELPRPGLAALLGFIPGVGAIYNGQFAKGIAHIVIFMFLSSLGHSSDFFGFLAFLWCCYQSYEAYHTAKARREGMPLPDPLGLNCVGEWMGFGKSGAAPSAGGPPNSYPGWTGFVPPQPYAAQSPYVPQPPYVQPTPADAGAPPAASGWASVPGTAPASPYTQPAAGEWVAAPDAVAIPASRNRFPSGAIWLIGLGLMFLIFNFVPDWRFSLNRIVPFLLMGLAGWILVRRLKTSGGVTPRADEGAAYGARVVNGLRAPAVLFTVGVLMALQTFSDHNYYLRFGRTWPVLVIVLGAVLLLERSMTARASIAPPAGDNDGKGY